LAFPGQELGRIAEQEPNDGAAIHRLPPVWAGSSLEIAGSLSEAGLQFPAPDTLDRFRFRTLVTQEVDLALEVLGVGGVASGVQVEVRDAGSGDILGTTSGAASPFTLTFTASGAREYDLRVSLTAGDALYVVSLALSTPPGALVLADPASGASTNGVAVGTAIPAVAPVAAPAAAMVLAQGDPACAPGRILLRCVDDARAATLAAQHGLKLERRLSSGTCLFSFACDDASEGRHEATRLAAILQHVEGVVLAEPDYIVSSLATPNDPEFPRQWNMHMVGATSAWDITTGDASVVVGVVDSGTIAHPQLAGQEVPGFDFISEASVAGDGDGRDADPTDTGDGFLSNGFSSWHGAHVSAIIVAKQNDNVGITGLAPGCRVMPLRALGRGGGFVSDVADAILYAAGLGPDPNGATRATPLPIVNLSLGLSTDSAELRDACDRAETVGVLLVAAAGNNGASSVLFPARYDSVMAVSAVDGAMDPTSYSNSGPNVEIAAPGGLSFVDAAGDGWPDAVLSTAFDETLFPAPLGYRALVGTSQATPHISAVAALLLSLDPTLTPAELRGHLRLSALDLGPAGDDVAFGAGLVQAHAAVRRLLAELGTPRADAPQVLMPLSTLRFKGFESSFTLPIDNGGGGLLALIGSPTITDDGNPWLSASLTSVSGDPNRNVRNVVVTVGRAGLPSGRYSGVIRLTSSGGVQASIRVVMYSGPPARIGSPLVARVHEFATGQIRRSALVGPDTAWRYWFTNFEENFYYVQAGEDLDGDGTLCEPMDGCGFLGGASAADAESLLIGNGLEPRRGADIVLVRGN